MPTIDYFDGIKINIYYGEHLPPHIHAVYNEYEMLLEIETYEIYGGYLPPKQLKKAINWLLNNQVEVKRIFFEFNTHLL